MMPIFPLGTVLFPDGVLPLRIFEARYVDMVRACLRDDQAFGVCLITAGHEVGEAADHEPIGCTARIVDWDMEQLGVLLVRAIGGQRFRVVRRSVGAGQLVSAEVESIDPDPFVAIPDPLQDCVTLLRRIVEDVRRREPDPKRQMIAEPYRFDAAGWVANRLCEFVPVAPRVRHQLMALEDPIARLGLVRGYLQRHQVL